MSMVADTAAAAAGGEAMDNPLERMLFFSEALRASEATYATDPLDAENLTRWGGALLELSQFQEPNDSMKYCRDAIAKLEEALKIDANRHNTLWCLGNAHTSLAFYTPDFEIAKGHFAESLICFQRAVELDPDNSFYRNSLELAIKAPEIHKELQRQMVQKQETTQQVVQGPSPASNVKKPRKKKSSSNNDFVYDVLGWVILGIGIAVWAGAARSLGPST